MSLGNSINHRGINANPSEVLLKKGKGGNILKPISWNQHYYPDTDVRLGHYKKIKLQPNNHDKPKCKILNKIPANKWTEQLKHHTPQSTGIYLWNARTVHHIYRITAKKFYDYLNKWRKTNWQNTAFFHDKNSQQTGYKSRLPQHNKGINIQQTHS